MNVAETNSWAEPTNADRAKRARQLMEYYSTILGEQYDEDNTCDVAGIIADLMHYCDTLEPRAFKNHLNMAHMHHDAERDEEEPRWRKKRLSSASMETGFPEMETS